MIKILDCTLRDGGYYTDWDFDEILVCAYLKNISYLPIEYIEIGYKSKEKEGYYGEYFYLPLQTIKKIKHITTKKCSIMINAKDCYDVDIKTLLESCCGYIDMVRIAIDPRKIDFGIILARKIKEMNFKITLNVMYISKINNDDAFFNYLTNLEEIVDYLYLVDSYGAIYPDELVRLINNIKKYTTVKLGFHGHNNLELALINTIQAINNGIEIVDATILGMGRGAGNLKLELLLAYLKSKQNFQLDFDILCKVIELFRPLHEKYRWGTNLAYIVSGSYSLPQKDVMEALEINRYSLSSIVNTLYDKKMKLPVFFEDNLIDRCVIIGGGENIRRHLKFIQKYLNANPDILVIHSTSRYIYDFIDLKNLQYFAVAGDELSKLESIRKLTYINKFIFAPSPRKIEVKSREKNFYELIKITFIDKYFDSPLAISLQIALETRVSDIALLGFDGYEKLNSNKELYLLNENQEIINSFVKLDKNFYSLTKTRYKNIKQKSLFAII